LPKSSAINMSFEGAKYVSHQFLLLRNNASSNGASDPRFGQQGLEDQARVSNG